MNLSRLSYHPDSQLFLYKPKPGADLDDESLVAPLEFLARVLIHIPTPHKHLARFYGVYAHRIRATCRAEDTALAGADGEAFRPGMVSVVQTFGEAARFHPHVHALCSRGGWNALGQWMPVPYLDHRMAEELFRHRVLRLLHNQGLLSEERIRLLLSWERSGFSIDDSVRIPAGEKNSLETVARYMLRSPVSLSRLQWTEASAHVLYAPKTSPDDPSELFPRLEKIDALEFLARVITQIPEPRRHLLFYYGHYANVVRGRRLRSRASQPSDISPNETQKHEPTPSPPSKQALRRRWADLIRRVFELDPLRCPCGGTLGVVAFITEPVTYCL